MNIQENVVEKGAEVTAQVDSTTTEQTANVDSPEVAETSEKMSNSQSTDGVETVGQAIPYERFKEVNDKYKGLSAELETYKSKAELLDKLQSDPELARSVLQNFKPEAVREVDPQVERALQVLRDEGFLTKDDMEREFQRRQGELQQQQQEAQIVESFKGQVDELSKKYDGKNGLPAFEAESVADFMDTNGIIWDKDGKPDVEAVYFLLNREALIDAQAKQVRSTAFSERETATSATPDNANGLLADAQKSGNFKRVFETLLK